MPTVEERIERTRVAGQDDDQQRSGVHRFTPAVIPALLLLMALVLPGFMFTQDQRPSAVGLGPAAWPNAMLGGLAVFAAIWLVRELWVGWQGAGAPLLNAPVEDEHYHLGKALTGLGLILAYGWLMPVIGFALATALFINVWCWVGGLRHPLLVASVAVIGTVALLWLFMGLALMPLPRGTGIFDGFSIWLLRATGIY